MLLIISLCVIILLLLYIHWYFTRNYYYFERIGFPVYKKHNVYKDTYYTLTNKYVRFDEGIDQYNAFPDKDIYGIYEFRFPHILIKDPELLKLILIKDFDHFTDHFTTFFTEETEPFFGKGLFALTGKRWHDMRVTLSPAFTGRKMRAMVSLLNEVGDQLMEYLQQKVNRLDGGHEKVLEVDMGDVCTRFTNDAIGSIAFGIKIDSLKYPNNDFYKAGQNFLKLQSYWRFVLIALFPDFCNSINLKGLPSWIYKFFTNIIKETLETRERENIIRPDMLHLLNEARKGRLEDDEPEEKENGIKGNKIELSLEDIVSQAFLFFVAGYTGVGMTMCWALYELALNPDIQDQLYNEITKTLQQFDNKITYDVINKMKYLDLILSETLRKWPGAPTINRLVTKPYRLKTKDGELYLEEGKLVSIPIAGIHRDPKYYPNPDKFDPERFRDSSKINPCTYLPFGDGPRFCIGQRLALLEIKVFIVILLSKFQVVVIKKTPIPPVLKMSSTSVELRDGFWLGLKCRKN